MEEILVWIVWIGAAITLLSSGLAVVLVGPIRLSAHQRLRDDPHRLAAAHARSGATTGTISGAPSRIASASWSESCSWERRSASTRLVKYSTSRLTCSSVQPYS